MQGAKQQGGRQTGRGRYAMAIAEVTEGTLSLRKDLRG
jgi:hypothetical protein